MNSDPGRQRLSSALQWRSSDGSHGKPEEVATATNEAMSRFGVTLRNSVTAEASCIQGVGLCPRSGGRDSPTAHVVVVSTCTEGT